MATADLRAYVGDPNFASDLPLREMLGAKYTAERAAAIVADRAQSLPAGVLDVNAGSDTSYVAVSDAYGNSLSLLQSVFFVFGCGLVVPGTGVLMNNRMTGFSLEAGSPNVLAAGKRAMHTLNPLLVRRDGKTIMCLGTPGGPSQTYTNSLLLLRLLDQNYDVQSAIEAPRWFVAPDGKLNIETTVGEATLATLERWGHSLVRLPQWHSSMGGAGVMRLNAHGVRENGADPRRENYAVAY
jgi:gamma-glutamyltranspeptidase/glutathione hydrolase